MSKHFRWLYPLTVMLAGLGLGYVFSDRGGLLIVGIMWGFVFGAMAANAVHTESPLCWTRPDARRLADQPEREDEDAPDSTE